MRAALWLLLASMCFLVSSATALAQTEAPDVGGQIQELRQKIKDSGRLFNQKEYEEAAKLIQEAQAVLDQLAGGDLASLQLRVVEGLSKQIDRAWKLLKAKGLELPDTPSGNLVSFSTQIAPLLVGKCSRCHIQRESGGLSMATYVSLGQGSDSGPVVAVGDRSASRLWEVLKSGEMPPNGAKVTDDEIALVGRWIDTGARFDGPDPRNPLTSLAAAAAPPTTPEGMQETPSYIPTGEETVSFARDIAPLLVENCLICHGGRQPAANFSLASFTQLMSGGDSGEPFAPGEPDDSILMLRLTGEEAGPRMPARKPPLSAEQMAMVQTWIAEGAKFDGPSLADPTSRVADWYRASHMKHDELATLRQELAGKTWHLAVPDEAPKVHETENFLLVGNVTPQRLTQLGELAEQQAGKLATWLKRPDGEPWLKGRLTLFVFRQRFDYSEFGQMVESREVSRDRVGHWRYDVIEPYACLLDTSGEDEVMGLEISELLSGVYLAGQAELPEWFLQGSARAIAAKIDARLPEIRERDRAVLESLAGGVSPEGLLSGQLPENQARLLQYGFVKSLLSNEARYRQLLEAAQGGQDFDAALEEIYGIKPATLVSNWAKTAANKRR